MTKIYYLKQKKEILVFIIAWILILSSGIFSAPEKITVSGTITSEVTDKPLEFATIAIIESRLKTKSDENGAYTLEIPKPGTYTFVISAENLKPLQEVLEIKTSTVHDFLISAIHVTGKSLTVRSTRDLQQVSRTTMNAKEIKQVPAGFNDIVRSLASMPGITSRGFFGSLVIRGADPDGNYYSIDNIPIMDPRHFLGLHTIISSDAISEVDVFSSAAPASFGFTNAAVISMNTLDEVKKTGGSADIGLISANAIIKGPIISVENNEKINRGYWFISGRVGYLSVLFPIFNTILKSPVSQLPEYYDYQGKIKYYLNEKNSIRLFVMGTGDKFLFNPSPAAQAELFKVHEGDDPLNTMKGVDVQYSLSSHNQGVYYEFKPGDFFSNTLMVFSSFNDQIYNMKMTYGSGTADISKKTLPNIYGLKDDLSVKWINNDTVFKLGLEYYYFDFKSSGIDIVPLKPWIPGISGQTGPPNFSDPAQYELRPYDKFAKNEVIGGYAENKFKFGGFVFMPGIRLDYLQLSKELIWDPRGLISYEFDSGTLVSIAGGKYSQFMQSNMSYFDRNPVIAVTPDYLSEKALHSVFGVEQKFKQFSIKGEVYYNYFYDTSYAYRSPDKVDANGDPLTFINSGVANNYGFEILLKKFASEDEQGLFGWISYTWTQAKLKTGVPNQSYKDKYIDSQREEVHSVKGVAGYRFGAHTISGKLAVSSSFPYTTITGDDGDPFQIGRYAPVYNSTPNTRWFDPSISLDLRYSWTKPVKWGEISFYIEALNVLGAIYKPRDTLKWRYDKPYQEGVNPTLTISNQVMPFVPNFGVEIKF